MSTFRDYLWLKDEPYASWVDTGYLVSLIRDATSRDVLDALRAFSRRPRGAGYVGFRARVEELEALDRFDQVDRRVQFVGVADVGDGWVLMIQNNSGFLGIDEQLMRPVIDQHEVVSHFSNVNAVSRFVWWRDGARQVSFEPMLPSGDLDAAAPTAGLPIILALIPQVGGIERDSDEPRTGFFHREGAFALAERLTGVAVTKDLLESTEFTVAIAPTVPADDGKADFEALVAEILEIPPRHSLLGDRATWEEVVRLNRSWAEATIHGTFVLTDSGSGTDERAEVEFWIKPHKGSRQADREGLVAVSTPQGHWHRGPYAPDTSPEQLIAVHLRWGCSLADLLPASAPAMPTAVAGRRAWEFVLPPPWRGGHPVAVAFDARTGIVVRAETDYRTEELFGLHVDEELADDLFALPE
jgi:hypothetical protein